MARRRAIISSLGADPSYAFVGSSPVAGDTGGFGLILPPDATARPNFRLLCRLAAIEIGFRTTAILREVRQYLTIGQIVEGGQGESDYIVERQVVTPHWHFLDGNVSWHITTEPLKTGGNRRARAVPASNYSNDDRGLHASILYQTLPTSVDPGSDTYRPLFGGRPPGRGVSGLGMMHDMRWPWRSTRHGDCGQPVLAGPCRLTFWASVRQTDVEDRTIPALPSTEGLEPEEVFLQNYRSARYWRIAGELVVDLYSNRERCYEK